MSMLVRAVLAALLDGIAQRGDQPEAVFLFDEVRRWPSDAIAGLITAKLLKKFAPADSVTCEGCDERCRRPVTLIEAAPAEPRRLVSTCHLKAEFGPFEHSSDRMERWASSRELVAKFVGRSAGLSIAEHDDRWQRVRFGAHSFGGVRRLLSLEFEASAIAKIGSTPIPLIELIDWSEAGIVVCPEAMALSAAQADDLQSGNKRVQPSTAVRDDKKLMTELKVRRMQRELERLAGQHPNLSKEQLAKRIEKSGKGEGMTAARIARVTRMPT
jgi:hypothetical protein